jgi:hypothetical protein
MIANRTTTVSAEKTVNEIQSILAGVRASKMMLEYDSDGKPSAIAFQIDREGQTMAFRLPCDWQGVLRALKRERGGIQHRLLTPDHAKRVSWRIIKDWLRAQLSLIEAGASTMEEVMLPWAITTDGQTVSQRVLSGSSGLLRLTGPTVN